MSHYNVIVRHNDSFIQILKYSAFHKIKPSINFRDFHLLSDFLQQIQSSSFLKC